MEQLRINNLSICTKNKDFLILDNINLLVEKSESLAIVGESGSGKTTIARAILRLLSENLIYKSGEIIFKNRDILKLSDEEIRQIRGREISYLPQESLNFLNPLMKCGDQIAEVLLYKCNKKKVEIYDEVVFMLSLCGFENPEDIYEKYPFELSGGNRQKILFAIANISKPELLIVDELTSSLDFISEKEILCLLQKFKKENNQTLIFITHDLLLAKEISDKMLILKSGVIQEYGFTSDIFNTPINNYTKHLIENASPKI